MYSGVLFSGVISLIQMNKKGEEALASGETPVGCVLVHNDEVIGSGMNDTNKSMNVRFRTLF